MTCLDNYNEINAAFYLDTPSDSVSFPKDIFFRHRNHYQSKSCTATPARRAAHARPASHAPRPRLPWGPHGCAPWKPQRRSARACEGNNPLEASLPRGCAQ